MRINRQDTNGTKPLLAVGELGYDNYPTGGDAGRVYVGNGSENIPQAKKSEVVTVDGKIDTHVARVDNPHMVTKTQVGLGSVDNTADSAKNVLSATKLTTARKINGVDFDGTTAITVTADTAQSEIIKFDTGTTEGKDLYTFNGSSAKTINIKAGTNVTLTKSTGSITINANDTSVAIDEVSGLGTGVSTFLSAPTSANLAGMLTDETGTGANVFANSPTLVTPVLGVATGTSFNSITGLSSTFPLVNGVATIGTSTAVAKADHIHPSDTTKVTKVSSTDNAIVRFNGTTGEVKNSGVIIDGAGNITASNTSSAQGGSEAFSIKYIEGQKVNVISSTRSNSTWSFGFGVKPSNTTIGEFISTVDNINWSRGALLVDDTFKFLRATAQVTPIGSTVSMTEVFRTTTAGDLLLTSGTGRIGYGTGAGGTVTQLTSKSTAVTLNKPTGVIVTHAEALDAGASVHFVLDNSLLNIGDILLLNVSNSSNYATTTIVCISSSAIIRLTNISTVSRSQVIDIRFAVIKGAIS